MRGPRERVERCIGVTRGSPPRAIVGLLGLRWQHSAERQHEVKQKCAALIFFGEPVRQELEKPKPFRKGVPVGEVSPWPESPVEDWHHEMTAILRFLELAAQQASRQGDFSAGVFHQVLEQSRGLPGIRDQIASPRAGIPEGHASGQTTASLSRRTSFAGAGRHRKAIARTAVTSAVVAARPRSLGASCRVDRRPPQVER